MRFGEGELWPELMTIEQAARYLNVSRRTLVRWQTEGIGPPSIKLPSGGRRYRRAALDAWLLEHEGE
jgi:excisionase family DNA binding protein